MSKRPPMTPPTIPPIAPPERPLEPESDFVCDREEGVVDADADADEPDGVRVGVADEAPGVVEVMASSFWASTENAVAFGLAELREE
jgi:hypothetical protein